MADCWTRERASQKLVQCKAQIVIDALHDCVSGGPYQSSLSSGEILDATVDIEKFRKILEKIL